MVGLVLVSHSAPLARAVVELAREMAGADVALVPAGGTAGAGDALGTDATRVAAAIEEAASPDGVLVLMDLGSALLSAELALELVDPATAAGVVLCEAPLVEGAVAAAVAAGLGRPMAEVAEEARRGTAAKAAHLAPGRPDQGGGPGTGGGGGEVHEARLAVRLPHGLHARPAARLVATVGPFDATVTVTNRTTGAGPADARSLTGLAVLGAREGHELSVRATGPAGAEALAAVLALATSGFGEAPPSTPPPPAGGAADQEERSGAGEPGKEGPDGPVAGLAVSPGAAAGPSVGLGVSPGAAAGSVVDVSRGAAAGSLAGLPVSPGGVAGPARYLRPAALEVPAGRAGRAGRAGLPSEEWAALERALAATRADVGASRRSVAAAAGDRAAAIFDAHLLLLDDAALLGPARAAVFGEEAGAAEAWQRAVRAVAAAFVDLEDPYQRARGADVQDVGTQVLAHLLGGPSRAAPAGPGVVVAAVLTPQELAGLDPGVATGLATAVGGPLDHAAILARALGIPAVFGLGPSVLAVPEGTPLVVDGDAGMVHVDPGPDVLAAVAARRSEAARRSAAARAAAGAPAVTRDGRRVGVEANVASPSDLDAALAAGSEGVGLLRTEFLFLGRPEPPGEDEQFELYAAMAARLDGRPLVVRTLDAGGDKELPWAGGGGGDEPNPALGLRGLRLGLARPDLLMTQLRAVARAAAAHAGVHALLPMVTTVDEVRRASALLDEAVDAVGSTARRPPLGVMVEVPAAALRAGRLAPHAAFFSIGTNDLTQYTLAVDRSSPRLAPLADGLDPAVLFLVQRVVAAAGPDRPVTVCGALAADPDAVPVLVGLGVDRLSVPAGAVPLVKQAVRELSAREAAALAERALRQESAAAVRALVREGR